ncbi:MAG TPA: ATP-binding protein [Lachnospiraceae bacterium]|nr:ATP-binding protein [Lachnospiraceae bacterium]
MITDDKRVRIITGHYGSGKTEFAVNYATILVRLSDRKLAFADMDIVNVYFRSREVRKEIMALGIRMIDSSANTSADLPAVPAEAFAPFEDKNYDYIIDLGGNDIGTNVLGRYKKFINSEETDFFMVVNVFRPDTMNVEKILKVKEQLENTSGLKVTGFVNNSNLVRETKSENILLGDEIISEASRITGIPIKYTTYVEEVVLDMTSEIKAKLSGEVIAMKYFMREPWM